MAVIFGEELRRMFTSSGSYALFAIFFLITGGLYFSVFMQASAEPVNVSPLQTFWELQWLPNLLWVPLVTMRLLAPQRRQGLLESTLATPTTAAAIVAGKYLAGVVMYLAGWSSVIVFMLITRFSGLNPAELVAVFTFPAMLGGALFCITSGILFLALGLWCSSVTKNSLLAAAFTVCLTLLYILLPALLKSTRLPQLSFLQPFDHLENLSLYAAGSIQLSVMAAYAIVALIILFAAALSLEHKAD